MEWIMEWIILGILVILDIVGLIFVLFSLTTQEEESEKKEATREEAKKNAKEEELNRRKHARPVVWWVELSLIISTIAITLGLIIKYFFSAELVVIVSLATGLIIYGFVLLWGYKSVPEKEHWTIELLGRWFTTWHPGPHFLLPFFMKISGKVYMGDHMCTLYMDDQERDGEIDALIDFTDASGGVIIRLYYRIFSAHRAVYNIDDIRTAVREKMDAGLRAYLGELTLDNALKDRAAMSLEKIMELPATEADVFKVWGVEIITLAMTDIILSPDVIKTREKIIMATKERDVAEINIKTAESRGKAAKKQQKLEGEAIGRKIQYFAKISELSNKQAASYLLTQDGLNAIKDNKGIFLGVGSGGTPQIGAEFAAGFAAVSESLKGSLDNRIDENTKPKKSDATESGAEQSETTKLEEKEKGGEK